VRSSEYVAPMMAAIGMPRQRRALD